MVIKKQKQKLRLELTKRLKHQKPSDLIKKSHRIKQRVIKLAQTDSAQTILCYASHKTEVQTHSLIKLLLKKKKRVLVPVVVDEAVKPALLSDFSELKPGKFNILQPITPIFFKGEIDLNLMPALAVDLQGNRLGKGSGSYDHFLNQFKPKLSVSLVFDFQVVDQIPVEEHDQATDGFISESKNYFI